MIGEIIGLLGVAVPAAMYAWDKWRGRVVVRQVVSQRDATLTPLLELYTDLFPDDGTNYTGEEVADWLPDAAGEEKLHHVSVKQVVLAAVLRKAVVGFAFCHYYSGSRGAIISYFGIDRSVLEARAGAPRALLTSLLKKVKTCDPPCQMVLFELQKPDVSLSAEENAERKARPVLFKRRAKDFGFVGFEVPVGYRRPRLSLENHTEGEPLTLMCVMMRDGRVSALTRSEVDRILRCLHLDGYGDYYDVADPRHIEYQAYLKSRVDAYVRELPEAVALS